MPLIARIAIVFASGAVAGAFLSQFALLFLCLGVVSGIAVYVDVNAKVGGNGNGNGKGKGNGYGYRKKGGAETLVLVGVALVGMAHGGVKRAHDRAACVRFADGARFAIRGVLETSSSESQHTVQLRTDATGPCRTLRVRLPDDAPDVTIGDEATIAGTWMIQRITLNDRPANDGMLIASHLDVERIRTPTPTRTRTRTHEHPLLHLRGEMQRRIRILFPATFPLAEALLIAQREAISKEVKNSFAASGLTHLLAISGTHVALVAGALLLLARLARFSHSTAAAISIAGSATYVLFLGAPFAALRALLGMLLLATSRWLQRPAHPLGLLAVAAIIITALAASAPLDAGFQLSFAGICGIVLWRRPLIDAMPASIPTSVRDAVATTLAATVVTTPIAAYQFGIVSIVAIVANLLAAPVIAIAVPTAAAALAVSYVSSAAGHFLAGGAELALLWLARIAQLCAAAPLGHFYVAPHTVLLYTGAALLAFRMLRGRYRSTAAGRYALGALVASLVLTAGPLLPLFDARVQIHMIDVGQGDAFAIRSPRGRWLLVDAGPSSANFDAGKAQIVPFLLQHQAGRIEAIVLSHPHLDHFGGARAIAQLLPVSAIVDPGMPVASPPFDTLLRATQGAHVPWLGARAGRRIEFDGVRMDFLSPDSISLDPAADPNDFSASFRLSYGRFSALFLGDLYAQEEERMVQRYGAGLDVDVLKVAHHGSGSSSSEALLLAASPRVALVSVGRRNRYGHPHRLTMARLDAVGARVFRSDRDGSVSIVADRNGRMMVRTAQ